MAWHLSVPYLNKWLTIENNLDCWTFKLPFPATEKTFYVLRLQLNFCLKFETFTVSWSIQYLCTCLLWTTYNLLFNLKSTSSFIPDTREEPCTLVVGWLVFTAFYYLPSVSYNINLLFSLRSTSSLIWDITEWTIRRGGGLFLVIHPPQANE